MKTFHYSGGHVAGSTMTVGELREALANFPDDMPVMVEWESCAAYVDIEAAEVKLLNKGIRAETCGVLVINVDRY